MRWPRWEWWRFELEQYQAVVRSKRNGWTAWGWRVTVKGSSQLVSDPESADGFLLLVYVPPAKNLASGLCRLYDVKLDDPAGDNVATDVGLTAQ